jgi:deoxyribodipyrimidine photo-lyase
VPLFIFDRNILDKLENKKDRRVEFIHAALIHMQEKLAAGAVSLEVYYGKPEEIFKKLLLQYKIENVYCNHDYEPYATERDKAIEILLKQMV